MIVLKHLSREFDIDPYRLRQILRLHKIPKNNGRYQWNENSAQLKKLRSLLGKIHATGAESTKS